MGQIWARKPQNKINHTLLTMFMLWQYVGIGFETNLSKRGTRILADPEHVIFMFSFFSEMIDHTLSPWPLVEPLTARLVPLRL